MIDILEEYKRTLLAEGFTIKYFQDMPMFMRFLKENELEFDDVEYSDCIDFMNEQKDRVSSGTVNNYIKAVRNFYDFLLNRKLVSESTHREVHKFKSLPYSPKFKPYITKPEVENMVEMAKSFYYALEPIQIEAIVWFLFYTGVRTDELLSMKREDIDLSKNLAVVKKPKGRVKEPRVVCFTVGVKLILQEMFRLIEEEHCAFSLTRGQFQGLMNELKNYSPDKPFTPHSLRHSFARYLHENKVDIKTIQKLMGHKNIATTAHYVDPDIDQVISVYKENIKK